MHSYPIDTEGNDPYSQIHGQDAPERPPQKRSACVFGIFGYTAARPLKAAGILCAGWMKDHREKNIRLLNVVSEATSGSPCFLLRFCVFTSPHLESGHPAEQFHYSKIDFKIPAIF